MPIDDAIVGHTQTATVDVEPGRLRMFADAIGERAPMYHDVEAARAAGHRDLPALPTVLFGLDLETSDTFDVLERHGVNLSDVLHGEQSFTYHHMVYAGDRLTFNSEFTDVYSKSQGTLHFVVRHTDVVRDDGVVVAQMDNTAIVREKPAS